MDSNDNFKWEYVGKKCYIISNCSYLGEPPKHIPLELVERREIRKVLGTEAHTQDFRIADYSGREVERSRAVHI